MGREIRALGKDPITVADDFDPYAERIRRIEYSGDPNDPRFTRPFWDVRQWTSGYGTRASGPDERVSREELEARFGREIESARQSVRSFAPGLDAGTEAALTSLTYNAGPAWQQAGLGEAIRRGDMETARRLFVQYTSSDPRYRSGLENRRRQEVAWFGQAAPVGGVSRVANGTDDQTMSLGALAPPASPTGDVRNAPQAPRTWSQALQAPDFRANLISVGLQLMTPTWGGPMAQAAAAIGAGAEAQAGTQQKQYDQELAQAQFQEGVRQRGLDRENRLQVAEIGAESRLDVAHVRTAAMLERARMIGLRTPAQQNEFAKQVRSIFNTLMVQNPVAGASRKSADELYEQALQMAARAVGAPTTGAPNVEPAPGPTGPIGPAGPTGGATGAAPQSQLQRSIENVLQGSPAYHLYRLGRDYFGGATGATGATGPVTGPTGPVASPEAASAAPINPVTGRPLQIGDVINGKRYIGGPWRQPTSWESTVSSIPGGAP